MQSNEARSKAQTIQKARDQKKRHMTNCKRQKAWSEIRGNSNGQKQYIRKPTEQQAIWNTKQENRFFKYETKRKAMLMPKQRAKPNKARRIWKALGKKQD